MKTIAEAFEGHVSGFFSGFERGLGDLFARYGGVGSTTDDQRYLRVAGREDDGIVEVEMLAMPSRRVSGAKRADDGDGLVETNASSTRVDTADLDLVAIFTSHADAEDESSWSELVDGRKLSCGGDGIA